MKSTRRVVITGMGVVSPLGNSASALWDALLAGRSGVAPLTCMPPDSLPASFAAEAREFRGDIEDFGPLEKEAKKAIRKGLKVMSRETQMGVATAQLALADAGFTPGAFDPERTGIVFGSDYMITRPEDIEEGVRACVDGAGRFDRQRWALQGLPQITPLWLLKYLPNMPASHVAIFNDLRGPNNSLTMREASSNHALGEAFRTITRGSADRMLAGATGTRLNPLKILHAFQQEETAGNCVDPAKASRPFDRDRTGVVLGEGAATVVLERLESAQARGAKFVGEVLGYAASQVSDRNLVARRDVALANVIRGALADAELRPDQLGHIHAHGLSTRTCDADEARAIRAALGAAADRVPVVAAKGHFGNLGAGGGMVELVGSLLALGHRSLFPTLNYERPDEDCPIHVVADNSTPAGETCLNLNVTPQGQASAVIVGRFRD